MKRLFNSFSVLLCGGLLIALSHCGSSSSPGAPTAGNSASGGARSGSGGNGSTSGASNLGGASSVAGASIGAGASNTSGASSVGGALQVGGNGGASGASAAGGNSGGVGGGGGATTGKCGSNTLNQHPFGCQFAWGVADPGGSLSGYSYVQFISYWVDSSISAAGTYTTCNGCNWVKNQVASSNAIPAYYAYIIGFLAHENGIVDGNQTGDKKLTTDGAALVKSHRAAIIDAYAWYAKETYKVWPTKPLVWLLEGDFVQFADAGQSSPLTYAEVGQLAADITCAIKSNMPNAVVAIDHSSWNSDDVTKSYWGAMKNANYDLVWTTGVGNNQGFIEAGTNSGSYNHTTANYAYLHTLTGRSVLVDTSAGISASGDSWSTATQSDLNARISEGVIAANITGTAPNGLPGRISALSGLNGVPGCQ